MKPDMIKNLMIVEDEMIVSKNLEMRLNDAGFNVIAAVSSGEKAIEFCKFNTPDCILMDIKLSGQLDGIQTAEIIKEEKNIPIIYLTAFADDEILEKAKLTDPFGYLLKPFDVRDLKKTIEIALYKNTLETNLRQSEEKFRKLFNHSPLGNVLFDESGKIVDTNPVFAELIGFNRREVINSNIWSMIYEKEKIAGKPGDLSGHIIETYLKKQNGEKIWVKISISSVRLPQLPEIYFLGVVEDITIKKQSEEILKESEFRLRRMVENLPAGAVYLDDNSFYFNKEVEAITGYRISDIHNITDWFEKLYPENVKLIYSLYSQDRSGDFKMPRVVEITRKDKEKRFVEFIAHSFSNGEVWILNDITDKVKAEEELLRSRDQLKKLSSYLQTAREEERANIAREVHDDLGQSLTALKMDIVWLKKNQNASKEIVNTKLEEMVDVINQTIKTIQRIGTELRPKLLDDLGLISALEWQTDEFQKRSGIECTINMDNEEIQLDSKVSLSVFRIFQEALTNIARHSNATNVDIDIKVQNSTFILSVADNGVGIPFEKLNASNSIGITGMKERADIVGGSVDFIIEKSKGTKVLVSVPFDSQKVII
ncbi:MAG: PAS domain S-box protein [Ignavibacteriaceae bacterium]